MLFEEAASFFSEQAILDEAGTLPEPPRNPRFTAAQLKKNRPEVYNLIVWMRLNLMPFRYVAEIAGVSTNTVDAIDREISSQVEVETVRKCLAADMRSLGRLVMERLREILLDRDQEDLDEGKLANVLKHVVEKAELLEGRATERIEWNPNPKETTDYEEYIRQAIPVDAQEMDPGVGKLPLHEGSALPGPPAITSGESDDQSLDSTPESQ